MLGLRGGLGAIEVGIGFQFGRLVIIEPKASASHSDTTRRLIPKGDLP
jgi:hypothetical protein